VAVLATVTNTPWGERHTYPLAAEADGSVSSVVAKALHVSPFFSMEQSYRFSVSPPGATLRVRVEVLEAGKVVLRASLYLERRTFSRRSVARSLLLHPASSWSVSTGIYWQAARLALKGAPFHAHPAKLERRRERLWPPGRTGPAAALPEPGPMAGPGQGQ